MQYVSGKSQTALGIIPRLREYIKQNDSHTSESLLIKSQVFFEENFKKSI